MIHPIPSGTRDVLPDELRELRAIEERIRAAFDDAGYGEIATPALEFETVLARGNVAATHPSHRFLDEHGTVLVLRSDMTLPIARVVATRYATTEPPLRFCYVAPVYRTVRPARGQARELRQAGVELIGSGAPDGTAEALSLLCATLDAVGLGRYRIGLGDASLYPSLLDGLGVPDDARDELLTHLVARDFVALERAVARLGIGGSDAALLATLPQLRGGVEVLERAAAGTGTSAVETAVGGIRRVLERVDDAVAARVILDLGLSAGLDYYTGAVFEVYDPALGSPLGAGGRYDELLGRFGRPLPAVGFALDLEFLHQALMREEQLRDSGEGAGAMEVEMPAARAPRTRRSGR
ncbi:MAG: ATP phosphoribosyltransferase regulatory subunit [Solirubrobacteraceae bacterium]|nr:MAG: ATP phosphoribosyltransferase regulatory subunit [Solirubrobacterales bacterium]